MSICVKKKRINRFLLSLCFRLIVVYVSLGNKNPDLLKKILVLIQLVINNRIQRVLGVCIYCAFQSFLVSSHYLHHVPTMCLQSPSLRSFFLHITYPCLILSSGRTVTYLTLWWDQKGVPQRQQCRHWRTLNNTHGSFCGAVKEYQTRLTGR